jgi:aminoglycoside phosphotransferase family enzyme
MTDLSPAAQAVLDAYMNNCGWLDGPLKKDYQCVAAVLRAAVAHTQMYQGNDCYSNEVWTCDADELLAIATELENQ